MKRERSSARTTPSFSGLAPANPGASLAASGASKKKDTRCEVLLRRALWRRGLRYRIAVQNLPGKPDLVFARSRVVVFCDGDFWHGRGLQERLARLAAGHNAPYWTAKIQRNVDRDRLHDAKLKDAGWTVIRVWETDVLKAPDDVAAMVERVVRASRGPTPATMSLARRGATGEHDAVTPSPNDLAGRTPRPVSQDYP